MNSTMGVACSPETGTVLLRVNDADVAMPKELAVQIGSRLARAGLACLAKDAPVEMLAVIRAAMADLVALETVAAEAGK